MYKQGGVVTSIVEGTWLKSSDSRYDFSGPAIAAKEMNDVIEATYYTIINGIKYKSQIDTYNLINYYKGNTVKSTPILQDLFVAIFNYGSAAQLYFNYNTENLVNEHLSHYGHEDRRMSTKAEFETLNIPYGATRDEMQDITDEGVYLQYSGAAAAVEQEISLISRYYYVDPANGEKLTEEHLKDMQFIGSYKTVKNGETVIENIVVPGSQLKINVHKSYPLNRVEVNFNMIAAKDLRSKITGYLADADGNRISETSSACFECYATTQLTNTSAKDTLHALLLSALEYSDWAAEYLNNR